MKTRLCVLVGILILDACAPISIFREDPTATLPATPSLVPPAQTRATSTSIPAAPVTSENNGVIAFYNNQFMGGIYLINADGSGKPVLLSAHPTNDSKPAWSPDGSQIAFESLRDDPLERKLMDIYIMDADGTHMKRLTQTDGWYTEPEWSPDGKNILIAGHGKDETASDLYLLDPKTGALTPLTNTLTQERNPSWSPDGSLVAFVSDADGNWNIQLLDLETGEVVQLTSNAGDNVKPDWSPDGKQILFVSTRTGDAEIFVMDADGGNQTRLTISPGVDTDPEWSPDGTSFVYDHGDNKFSELYIMKLGSSEPVRLFGKDGTFSGLPAWSLNAKISDAPAFGPPICMRDTNADSKPDKITNTFTAADGLPFVFFPYRNMTTDLITSVHWDFERADRDYLNMILKWKSGEAGWFWAANATDLSGVEAQGLKIQLSLNGEVVQEIECPVVSSETQSNAPATPTVFATNTLTFTPTPRPTSTPVPDLPKSGNLALRQPTSSSNSESSRPSKFAVDGNTTTDWGSGNFPPQWIEIDLGAPATLTEIRLLVTQYPNGNTTHRILVRSVDGEFLEIHRFKQYSHSGQWLEFKLEQPLGNIQIVRIETLESPSWVGWVEIEVIGER